MSKRRLKFNEKYHVANLLPEHRRTLNKLSAEKAAEFGFCASKLFSFMASAGEIPLEKGERLANNVYSAGQARAQGKTIIQPLSVPRKRVQHFFIDPLMESFGLAARKHSALAEPVVLPSDELDASLQKSSAPKWDPDELV